MNDKTQNQQKVSQKIWHQMSNWWKLCLLHVLAISFFFRLHFSIKRQSSSIFFLLFLDLFRVFFYQSFQKFNASFTECIGRIWCCYFLFSPLLIRRYCRSRCSFTCGWTLKLLSKRTFSYKCLKQHPFNIVFNYPFDDSFNSEFLLFVCI